MLHTYHFIPQYHNSAFLECSRIKEIGASLITSWTQIWVQMSLITHSELKCIACLSMFYFCFVARRGSSDLTYFPKQFTSVLVIRCLNSVLQCSLLLYLFIVEVCGWGHCNVRLGLIKIFDFYPKLSILCFGSCHWVFQPDTKPAANHLRMLYYMGFLCI